jgi:hypothetical protein
MKKASSNVIRRQRAIYYRSREDDHFDGAASGFQIQMFLEDVALRIMPIGGSARTRPFKVTLEPPDPKSERIIIAALSRERFDDSLESSLSEFCRPLASELCATDRALYEIVYLEDSASQKLVGFELFFIPQQQTVERRDEILQVIPSDVAQQRGVSELIPLPCEDLVAFKLPCSFRKAIQHLRENLSQLGGFEFAGLVMEAQRGKVPYEFKTHQRSMNLALAEACRDIGWTARGAFNGEVLSYYWIQKLLVFEKFQIALRESILEALNDGLSRIGRKIGFQATLTISGLPTNQEVDEAMQNLRSGSTAFTDIMDPFHRY